MFYGVDNSIPVFMANKFSKKYFNEILTQALKQGITPNKLAITCALGMVIGIFPIMGASTLICFILSIIFRLNIPVMQLVNYVVIGLQVICIVPFIKFGKYLFGLPGLSYSQDELIWLFQNDFWKLLKDSSVAFAGGVGAWLLVSIPIFFALYFPFLFLFTKWKFINPSKSADVVL